MALLPIGFVAIYQTTQATRQAEQLRAATYVGLTSDAAGLERERIQRAFGAAEALGEMALALRDDKSRCEDRLADFVARSDQYNGAAYIDQTGYLVCGSRKRSRDVSTTRTWALLSETIRPHVTFQGITDFSSTAILIIGQPVFRNGVWVGYFILTLPENAPEDPDQTKETEKFRPVETILLSFQGEILTSEDRIAALKRFMPANIPANEMARFARKSVLLTSAAGPSYRYVVVPVVPDVIYSLGIWPRTDPDETPQLVRPELFPLLMWIASMVTAYFALDRLVLRHLRGLNREMRIFGRDRRIVQRETSGGAPREFQELQKQFTRMAEAVLSDEEELERAVAQKSVLLKEVHHRVKNNLQMISSIMNMQIRAATSKEMRSVLTRLQDRILGLALVHRTLHEIEDMGQINAGRMLHDLLDQILSSQTNRPNFVVERNIADVELYPDQTVPLSLMFSELVANAMKHCAPGPDGAAKLQVVLHHSGEDAVVLVVENTTNEKSGSEDKPGGLGRRLIQAFASQLNARLDVHEQQGSHRVEVRFSARNFEHPTRDYTFF